MFQEFSFDCQESEVTLGGATKNINLFFVFATFFRSWNPNVSYSRSSQTSQNAFLVLQIFGALLHQQET